ncbi:MAG: hypothetical protein BGO29_07115 [Bacteroidales bacterium 36-12]|nr:MAG: hypothetical protein BGO29_07115 [Bacteroidales bacterium 36-12]
MRILFILLCVLLSITRTVAQPSSRLTSSDKSEISDPQYPLGISIGVGTRTEDAFVLFDSSLDYLFTPNLSVEASYGQVYDFVYKSFVSHYYMLGSKYWFNSNCYYGGFSPYLGLLAGSNYGTGIIEIPAGLSYISKVGLQASLQVSYSYFIRNKSGVPNVEFKLGWRFKAKR